MRLGFAVKVLGDGGLPSHDIRMYRMATALAPYASHPELTGFRDQPRECAAELEYIGRQARRLDVRLPTHPGQYTVLNSEDAQTGRLAVEELDVVVLHAHADLVDPLAVEHFLRETARGLTFDVMFEAKAKDLALLRVRDQLAARGVVPGASVKGLR